jgi:hypothetical protein
VSIANRLGPAATIVNSLHRYTSHRRSTRWVEES